MVKRQKEKQYQSAREHRANSQLRAGTDASAANSRVQRRLPFDCCALTLTPYQTPVCTPQGIMFENSALLPFLLKNKVDPVTGKTMTTRDVITLHMDKDEEGRWQCPVLTKPFSNQTKIVAIRQPGTSEANVYSFEAYQELNVKTKHYQDLISGVKFSKSKDVIILNDPTDEAHNARRDINNFHHILNARNVASDKSPVDNVKHSVTATRIMDQLKRKRGNAAPVNTEPAIKKKNRIFSDAVTGVQMTSGKVSGSLTSTSMDVTHDSDAKEATQEEMLVAQFQVMKKRKKKGYVTVHTSLGDLGLELHCDIAPRTCTNFLGLAEKGKYDNTTFHRLIPGFMIQGGQSTSGDDTSLWGNDGFTDEFDDRLTHTDEGIVSMANAGPGTNRRQFFLTFKSCHHLDRKHSVFGRVVQGLDVLRAMEKVPTDKKDRPIDEIKIMGIEVLKNPAKEAEEAERVRIQERSEAKLREEASRKASALGKSSAKQVTKKFDAPSSSSAPVGPVPVGKYLVGKLVSSTNFSKKTAPTDDDVSTNPTTISTRLPPPPKKTQFKDFSCW